MTRQTITVDRSVLERAAELLRRPGLGCQLDASARRVRRSIERALTVTAPDAA